VSRTVPFVLREVGLLEKIHKVRLESFVQRKTLIR